MKYAKLIEGYPFYALNPILVEDNYIGNPPNSLYEELGYKPVTYTQQPEPQGYGYYNEIWEETSTNIIQSWEWIVEEEREEE